MSWLTRARRASNCVKLALCDCCRALALIACCSDAIAATPPPLLPVRQVWTLALNNSLTAPPAYDAERAYFPLEGDRIVAYDLRSGEQQWLVSAKPQSEAAVGNGLLFFAEPDALTALHAADGLPAWRLPFAEPLATSPVWDNGWLVVTTGSGSILALRATDGVLIWRRDLGSPAHARPALASDRVYIPTVDGRIVALRIETGDPVWERRVGGPPNDILALEDRLYVGSKDNFFYCIMTKDGRVDWRWRTGGDVIGAPIADQRRVYFVALDNVLRALDLTSGVQQWMKALPLRPTWGPTLAAGTVLVAGQAPSLRAFAVKDGAAAGEVAAGAEVAGPPHVLSDPETELSAVLMITRDIAKGAAAVLVMHSVDPAIAPFSPLLNPIKLPPAPPPQS